MAVSRSIFTVLGLLLLGLAASLQAGDPGKSFHMQANETIMVGNTVLAPGSYVWKLMDSQSSRNIVQISTEQGNHVTATIHAIPKYRDTITGDNTLEYWETPAGYPRAVRAWFYPGDNYGQEFVYPQNVAAIQVKAPVTLIERPAPSPVVRPVHRQVAATAKIAVSGQPVAKQVSTQNPKWPVGSWAVVSNGPPATPQLKKEDGGLWKSLKALPLTATIAPLIGLIGLTCLAMLLPGYFKRRMDKAQ